MNILQIILVFVLACLGYPAGMIISKLTHEELQSGKKWFLIVVIVCAIAILASLVSLFFIDKTIAVFLLACFIFIFLLAFASFFESISKQNWKK